MGAMPSEYRKWTAMELSDWYNANRPRKSYGRMSEDQAKSITDRIKSNPEKYA